MNANPPTLQLHVAVADTGKGIDPDDQVKLFRPFSQIRPAEMQGMGDVNCHVLSSTLHNRFLVMQEEGVRDLDSVSAKTSLNEVMAA